MKNSLVSPEFVAEHREMYRWFRSQLEVERLNPGKQRPRKPMGMIPYVLTEALDGTSMFAKGKRLGVGNSNDSAQLVSLGQTANDGTFTLSGNDTDSSDIDFDASQADMQDKLDAVFGSNNTVVSIGEGGVWLVRFTGNLRGSNVDLMTANSDRLAGSQQVSIKKTPFNIEVQDVILFEFGCSFMEETLPAGTCGWAYHYPSLGYGIVTHNKHRPAVVMRGKANADIAAGADGSIAIYRGTQDTGTDISDAENFSDQQADENANLLVFEVPNEDGDLEYIFVPTECPA